MVRLILKNRYIYKYIRNKNEEFYGDWPVPRFLCSTNFNVLYLLNAARFEWTGGSFTIEAPRLLVSSLLSLDSNSFLASFSSLLLSNSLEFKLLKFSSLSSIISSSRALSTLSASSSFSLSSSNSGLPFFPQTVDYAIFIPFIFLSFTGFSNLMELL